jgi:Tol biopolymer transport system component
MRTGFRFLGSLIAVILTAAMLAAQTRPAEVLIEAAKKLEVVDGNCTAAIKQYREVVDRFSGTDRPSAATALLRIAECQQRQLGDEAAQKTYREIVANFADQGVIATTARARLEAAAAGPAGAFSSRDVLKFVDWAPSALLPQAVLARVSPDGKWLVFTRVNGPQGAAAPAASICLRDLRSGAERVVLANASGDRPLPIIQWSSDSRRLALSRLATEATMVRREIIVLDVADAASQPIRLQSVAISRQAAPARVPEPAAWSSDGRQLAYVSSTAAGAHEIKVYDGSTGRTRTIAPVQPTMESTRSVTLPQLHWSPDRSEVAFQNGAAAGADEVRIFRMTDGRERVVRLPAETGQRALLTAWTLRGLVLRREPQAARASNALVPVQTLLFDAQASRASVVCEGAMSDNNAGNAANETLSSTDTDVCLGVTSDGRHAIRWSTELQRVVLRDTATGRDTPLTSGVGEERLATLINNDQTVLFLSNADGRWGIYAAPIARAPVAKPTLIAPLNDLPSSAAIKPTSDGFVWGARYGGWSLWRVDTDPGTGRASGDPVRLTPDAGDTILAAVSPSGRRVAYWSRRGYRTGLAVMDANGANKRIVRETDQPRFHNYGAPPVWVSEDEILYADYSRHANQRKFFVINLRTGANTPMSFPELEAAPADGMPRSWQFVSARQEMVYVSRADPAAFAVFRARPLSGGAERTIATLDVPVSELRDFLVSPDGGRIAFRSRGRWQVYDVVTKSLVSSAGNFSTPGDWSADGRLLLTGLDGQPSVAELATGKSWPLLASRLSGNWMLEAAGDAAWWAPDRSYVILTLRDSQLESRQWHGVTAEAVAKATGAAK